MRLVPEPGWWAGRLVLVTGATGFIGGALAATLLERGAIVHGLDREWDLDDPLRQERIDLLSRYASFQPIAFDLRETHRLPEVLEGLTGAVVFHLAARPGVRDSSPPDVYGDNVVATQGLFVALRELRPAQVLFASSSSVYGRKARIPFVEAAPQGDVTSHYARSKLLGELAANVFHREVGLPVTVARLFNVYGERGRPDMAPGIFLRRITRREPVLLAANGAVERDLTYIADVVEALLRLAERASRESRMEMVNVGTGFRTSMRRLVAMLEARLGRSGSSFEAPFDPLDLPATQADLSRLRALLGWTPTTSIEVGLDRFVAWATGQLMVPQCSTLHGRFRAGRSARHPPPSHD